MGRCPNSKKGEHKPVVMTEEHYSPQGLVEALFCQTMCALCGVTLEDWRRLL